MRNIDITVDKTEIHSTMHIVRKALKKQETLAVAIIVEHFNVFVTMIPIVYQGLLQHF